MSAEKYEDLAREAFLAGKLEVALQYVDRALELDSGRTHVYLLATRIYLDMDDTKNALASVNRALELDHSAEALRLKADTLNIIGHHNEAFELANKAVAMLKKDYLDLRFDLQSAFITLTESATALGNRDFAQAVLEESIEIGTGSFIL